MTNLPSEADNMRINSSIFSRMSNDLAHRTRWMKAAALRHGFMGAGISKAEHMGEEARRLETWLSKDYHGEMSYMANHFELRTDPTKLVPGARSVISLMYNYFPGEKAERADGPEESSPLLKKAGGLSLQYPKTSPPLKGDGGLSTHHSPFKISRYAYGEDYHKVVRRKLKALLRDMKSEFGDFHARVFVDSGPVLERDWAKRSGLGWIGRNTLLIDPRTGSYFFLAEIILDLQFEYDHPIRDHCGTCRRCIDACPTDAISEDGYVLDGSKCISYLTIELKSAIPDTFKGHMENWIFGCDICQEVCPWNRFSTPHEEPAFKQNEKVNEMRDQDWKTLKEDLFDELFSKTPLKRTGFTGLKRNIRFVSD